MKDSWVGLLDCNNFFVSCERLFRPDLQRVPVVVLSSNDGCIVARSQEVKDMGVPMGVPYFKVKDSLEKAGTKAFSSHFALYRDISRRVFEVMREELDVVEPYSVDEAFFSLPEPDPAILLRVKQAVETRVGIPVSLGLAQTKTLAKYANTLAKKGSGSYIMSHSDWQGKCETVPLADIWGVGGKLELAYKKHGVLTVADLLATPDATLKTLFGINGLRLKSELQGVSCLTVDAAREPQKSIVSSRTFSQETTSRTVVEDAVAYHVREVVGDLRTIHHKTTVLRVFILTNRFGDNLLRGGAKEYVFTTPTNNLKEILGVAEKLVESLFEPGVAYKKAGVALSEFLPETISQTSLFESTEAPNQSAWEEVLLVVEKLNGSKRNQVLLGSRLRESDWQAKKLLRSPAYTTNWRQLVEVKA
jgi:DNA polymerase V